MLKINATDMNLKQITDSAAGAKRYKADKVQAFIEGIGEVTLYVTAYGAKPVDAPAKTKAEERNSPQRSNGQPSAVSSGNNSPKPASASAPANVLAKLGMSVEELKALKALLAS